LQQALRDLAAWVEKGVTPAASTSYRIDDGQVIVPAGAAERRGIQPVVALQAEGKVRADVKRGRRVHFTGTITVPPGGGAIVARSGLRWHRHLSRSIEDPRASDDGHRDGGPHVREARHLLPGAAGRIAARRSSKRRRTRGCRISAACAWSCSSTRRMDPPAVAA
jgi:hypothetical protein